MITCPFNKLNQCLIPDKLEGMCNECGVGVEARLYMSDADIKLAETELQRDIAMDALRVMWSNFSVNKCVGISESCQHHNGHVGLKVAHKVLLHYNYIDKDGSNKMGSCPH